MIESDLPYDARINFVFTHIVLIHFYQFFKTNSEDSSMNVFPDQSVVWIIVISVIFHTGYQ